MIIPIFRGGNSKGVTHCMAKKQTADGGRSTSSAPKKAASRTPKKAKQTRTTSRSARNKTTQSRAPKTTARRKRSSKPRSSAPKSRARSPKKRPPIQGRPSTWARARATATRLGRTLQDPRFWQRAYEKRPPWVDEMGAILLLVLGVVLLTALLNTTSEATFSALVSHISRQLFGNGAYLFALGVAAVGVVALLPKFGMVFRLGWVRFTALEVTFGALLALFHLAANDPQPRALAHEGGGGGYVGWALSQLVVTLLGRALALALFGAVFAGGVAIALRLRVHHLVAATAWLRARLQRALAALEAPPSHADTKPPSPTPAPRATKASPPQPPQSPRKPARPHTAGPAQAAPAESPEPSLAPKRRARRARQQAPNAPAPTSKKSAASPPKQAARQKSAQPRSSARPTSPKAKAAPATKTDAEGARANGNKPAPRKRPLTKAEMRALAEHTRRTMGASNGRSLVAPGEPGERPSIVPRELLPEARVVPAVPRARQRRRGPGGPTERYFTVDDFRETRKVGKRDANLPPLELLSDIELNRPTEEEINLNARIIRETLLEFDVEVEVVDVSVGPTVTQYAVSPYTEQITEDGERILKRVRVSEITNLASDLALALSAKTLRIQAPVPGHSYVGIEVPNRKPSTVALRPVLESEQFYKMRKKPLALPLGRDVSGTPFVTDLATMPHLLIAGTTGSGKSIMLAAMTTALVVNNLPEQVRLVLLDPKMVELSRFNGLPHLLGPVETELDRIIGVLRWVTREMERRYKLLEKEAARNLEAYNASLGRRRKHERLPYIVVIIDEIGDLMMQRPDETERTITRLAQMARAVGIHLMIATQRPSVDVITGLIKANFPARISFAVASGVDSRVILDTVGAETLMGRGDMLFLAPDASGVRRIQGCYVSDEEVEGVVRYWKEWHQRQIAEGAMQPVGVAPWERGMTRREVLAETDPMLEDAIALVVQAGEASASLIQRRLGLGYPRAARLIDLMHELGIIGPARPGGRTRRVLIKPGADPFQVILDARQKKRKGRKKP